MKSIYTHNFCKIIIISLLITMLRILLFYSYYKSDFKICFLIETVFTNVHTCDGKINPEIVIYILEFYLLLSFVCKKIIDTIELKSKYIFTRIITRKKWFLKEILIIISEVLVYNFVSVLATILFTLAYGVSTIKISEYFSAIVVIILGNVLYQIFICTIIIVMSLFVKYSYILLTTMIVQVISMMLVSVLKIMNINIFYYVKYNILLQGIYTIKGYSGNNTILQKIVRIDKANPSSILYSFVFVLVFEIIILLVGCYCVDRKDII